jgi:hypothetical protein
LEAVARLEPDGWSCKARLFSWAALKSLSPRDRGSNQRASPFVYPMTPRHESPFLFIYKSLGVQTGVTVQPFNYGRWLGWAETLVVTLELSPARDMLSAVAQHWLN